MANAVTQIAIALLILLFLILVINYVFGPSIVTWFFAYEERALKRETLVDYDKGYCWVKLIKDSAHGREMLRKKYRGIITGRELRYIYKREIRDIIWEKFVVTTVNGMWHVRVAGPHDDLSLAKTFFDVIKGVPDNDQIGDLDMDALQADLEAAKANLEQANAAIKALQEAAPPPREYVSKTLVEKPEKFSGKHSDWNSWIYTLKTYLKYNAPTATDEAKRDILISYLKDAPHDFYKFGDQAVTVQGSVCVVGAYCHGKLDRS